MSICCKAIRQIYYNAGSGYTVASYMTNEDLPEEVKKQKNGNYGIFQAFGTELPTNEGLDVELTGDWKPTKYGMQYSVSNFSVTMPTTKEGIRTYLSSSLIKGIGPAMAARIVETFGEDTLNVFNDSPEKLLQVKGITQKRLDDILEGYQKSSSIRELMMYLSPFGVTPAKVSKIQEKFGPASTPEEASRKMLCLFLSFVCRKLHNERGGNKMPDLCFYAPWIMKEPIPDPFRMMLEKAGKKRISYDEADCSMRNIRKQGKVSRLHGPTLHALLTLIQIRKEKDSGAAGIQRGRDAINYFCMEYPGNQGKYVMTYNSKNGRFSGILKTEEKNEKLPGIREGKNTGEQYLALLAYANLVPDNPLFNEEFQKNFYILEEQEKKEWEDMESALRAAFICCDAMYCEVIANPQQAVPLEKSQFRAEELEDVLPEYKIAAGVYAPNDEIYGKFHVLLPVNEKTKRTLFELKQIYSGRWDVNERTKERIPSLPEDYLVSKEAEEILQMVDKTPARLFMMTGDAGTGKTTDARMIAQILRLPYYVFTCGPGTDELELLATTVPNMGGTAHLEMELPRLEDIEMDPASALATVNGIYEEGISREKAFQEILKAVYEKGYEKSKNEKDFLLKESEIVKACREPSVIEIQEPAMIEKPGTLTRLNSLFDDGAVTDLVNGEQIRRNPDTIVIMTTNLDYVGCQNFNQSVLSRMNLIQPKEALTEEEMAKRAMKRTGFKNKELLSFMAATVCKIHEYLIEQDITDGVCGYRELENWVLSYMVSNDLRRSAWTALLSKASMDREERGTMERVFLLPHCDVD